MYFSLKSFFKREDGAVTVDWVVLTAALVGLAVFSVMALRGETGGISERTGEYVGRQDPTQFTDIQSVNDQAIGGGGDTEDGGDTGGDTGG